MASQLPPNTQKTVDAYNELADLWVQTHDTPGYWRKEMERLALFLPSGRVLDMGSGTGQPAHELTERGYSVLGVDPSVGMLKLSRERFPDLDFQEGSFLSIPGDELFDGFWCVASLIHVTKCEALSALRSLHSRMKPGAVGFFVVKEGVGEIWRDEQVGDKTLRRFFALYSVAEITSLIIQSGFAALDFHHRSRDDGKDPWLCIWVRK